MTSKEDAQRQSTLVYPHVSTPPPPGSTPGCPTLGILQLQIPDCPGPGLSPHQQGVELPWGSPMPSRFPCRHRGGGEAAAPEVSHSPGNFRSMQPLVTCTGGICTLGKR